MYILYPSFIGIYVRVIGFEVGWSGGSSWIKWGNLLEFVHTIYTYTRLTLYSIYTYARARIDNYTLNINIWKSKFYIKYTKSSCQKQNSVHIRRSVVYALWLKKVRSYRVSISIFTITQLYHLIIGCWGNSWEVMRKVREFERLKIINKAVNTRERSVSPLPTLNIISTSP